jgi:hypothetical protein
MRHRALAAVAAALTAGTLLSGCTTTSYACNNNVCSVTATGQASFEDLGPGWDVQVVKVESSGVTLTVDGSQATVPVGQSAQVGAVNVTVKEVAEGKATMEIRGLTGPS